MPVTAQVWTVHTEVFDGPLDLLLYLVKRDGIDLARLSVARVADSYLRYLDQMRDLRLEVASEYLVMAAELCRLKSLTLLPRLPTPVDEQDEPDDPAAELARRIREYERFKAAGEALGQRVVLGRDAFGRSPAPIASGDRPVTVDIDAFGLLAVSVMSPCSRYSQEIPWYSFGNS